MGEQTLHGSSGGDGREDSGARPYTSVSCCALGLLGLLTCPQVDFSLAPSLLGTPSPAGFQPASPSPPPGPWRGWGQRGSQAHTADPPLFFLSPKLGVSLRAKGGRGRARVEPPGAQAPMACTGLQGVPPRTGYGHSQGRIPEKTGTRPHQGPRPRVDTWQPGDMSSPDKGGPFPSALAPLARELPGGPGGRHLKGAALL